MKDKSSNPKLTKDALNKSMELLADMTSQIPGVVFQFYARANGEMGMYYISGMTKKIFGVKHDSLRSFKDLADFVVPEYKESFLKSIEKAVREAIEWNYEGVMQRPDGRRVWFSGHSIPYRRGNEVIFNGIIQDIDERKKAEEMLARQKEFLSVTLRSIGDGVIVTDMAGKVTMVNRIAEMLTGWLEPEASGRPLEKIFNIVNEKTRERCENPVKKVLESGKVVGLANHTVLIAKDGTEIALADSGAPIRDEKGNVIGVVLVFRDVTAGRRQEKALQESEAKYRALYDSSADAIMLAIPEKGFIAGNKATLKMFGCKDEKDFLSNSPGVLSPRYQPDGELSTVKSQRMMALALEKGSHFFEWVHKRMDGKEFYATVLLTRIELGGKKILQATVRDISGEKKAQEEKARFAAIIESSDDAIVGKSLDGVITSWNGGAQKIYGYKAEEVVGRNVSILVPPGRAGELPKIFERLKRGEHIDHFETMRVRKDGKTITVSLTVSPIKDAAGGIIGASAISRDITLRKENEARIRQADVEWKRTFDSVADPIFIVDTHNTVMRANKALLDILKLRESDVIGKKCFQIMHGITKPWPECPLEKTKSDKKSHTEEVDDPHIGIPLLVTTSPIFNDSDEITGIVHTAKDISEVKKTENELKNKIDELERFQKITVGRELKMKELKARISELETRIGEKA